MTLQAVYRYDVSSGKTGAKRATPQGGLLVDASLTRTGVFPYRAADGSVRRELRPPEEVFARDSLDSYKGAPVTVGHPGRVGPGNWKDHAVGHLDEVHRNGDFVDGPVRLQHQDAIEHAASDKLREISMGYTCDLDPTPGVYQGQKYDAVQRNIRINHAALLPAGEGRMGPDARLHMDSNAAVSFDDGAGPYVRAVHDEETVPMAMTTEEKAAFEKAQDDARQATKDLEKARQDAKDAKTEGEKLAAQARADAAEIAKLRAENDALKMQLEEGKRSSLEDKRRADGRFQADVEDLIEARADAREVFATAEDPKGEKYDAKGKTAEQIRMEIIAHLAPKVRLDGIKKIADAEVRRDALQPTYDQVMSHKRETDKAREDAMRAAGGERRDGDAAGDDDVDAGAARAAMIKRKKDGYEPAKAGKKK